MGTVGTLMPGVQYRLEAVPGIEEGGLLHVKGPNLMACYLLYDNPGKLVAFDSEEDKGWYNTGDIVTIDDGGFVTIRGRAKRFAKIAGEMVSLEVVETIARTASPEWQHASVARPDEAKGEMIVLFTTDKTLTRERLSITAKELGQPELAVARTIRHCEAIPLLGTGKTDYVTMNRLARETS